MGLTQAKLVEIRHDHARFIPSVLLTATRTGRSRRRSRIGDLLVVGRHAAATVHHEDDRIGLGDGLFGLTFAIRAGCRPSPEVRSHRYRRPDELAAEPAVTVATIPRQAGKIGDQRVAARVKAVE